MRRLVRKDLDMKAYKIHKTNKKGWKEAKSCFLVSQMACTNKFSFLMKNYAQLSR